MTALLLQVLHVWLLTTACSAALLALVVALQRLTAALRTAGRRPRDGVPGPPAGKDAVMTSACEEPGADEEVVQVDLSAGPHAPGDARRATREVLRRWELPSLVDRVVLVVSELVTNSVRYGRPPLRLDLRRLRSCVRVDVHDTVPEEPRMGAREVDLERESGRGLLIVSAVADDVGVEQVPGDGKLVYASFDT